MTFIRFTLRRQARALLYQLLILTASPVVFADSSYINFETIPIRPLAISPDGSKLFAVNTPGNRLDIFTIIGDGLIHSATVPVGLDPVAVSARSNTEVWVVNHLSDSVSIVDLSGIPHVVRTLNVGDEPWDIVFGGTKDPNGVFNRAFISAARRGQNYPGDTKSEALTPAIGRTDVWVFDATNPSTALGGTPETIVQMFGDKPRGLAVTPDGSKIYAAVFKSGSETTTIDAFAVCDGGADAAPCNVGTHDRLRLAPGGLPAPNANAEGEPAPEVGLIVKYNNIRGQWEDELGRDWSEEVAVDLPDYDVFEIEATGNLRTAARAFPHVGVVQYALAVNPQGNKVFVANTDAINQVRFETQLNGRFARSVISVIDLASGAVSTRFLNKHIDYSHVPAPTGVLEKSLALPQQLLFSADGNTLYVTAFGSNKIGIFSTVALENDSFVPNATNHITVADGGPVGIALDENHNRLYALSRYRNTVSIIDLALKKEIDTVALYNPEPPEVVAGRKFLYDATLTSGNGEMACASCHIFGDKDELAWDLGNPEGEQFFVRNPRPIFSLRGLLPYHPMKGPMTTQTLRGLDHHGVMHWRGDKTGLLDPDSVDAYDEAAAFRQFNVAFTGLQGKADTLSNADMQAFADFALGIMLPPNPYRNLDNSLTDQEAQGKKDFNSLATAKCNNCHAVNARKQFIGTDGKVMSDLFPVALPQNMKTPHLRNVYDKIGMFGSNSGVFTGFPPICGGARPAGSCNPIEFSKAGPQIRGFGFQHDGAFSLDGLMRAPHTFNFNDVPEMRKNIELYMLSFENNIAPLVGQQVTLGSQSGSDVHERIDLMRARAQTRFDFMDDAGECDLVVKGDIGGEPHGWVMMTKTVLGVNRTGGPMGYGIICTRRYPCNDHAGHYRGDTGETYSDGALRQLASVPGQELTFTCVPPGSGIRLGIDEDLDGVLDGE